MSKFEFLAGQRVRLLHDIPETYINPTVPKGTEARFSHYNNVRDCWIVLSDRSTLAVPAPYLELVEEEKQNLHLDVSLEKARALHRVWRALNDGDCPKCHRFCPVGATGVERTATQASKLRPGAFPVLDKLTCPNCGFFVTGEEIEAIEKMFAPAMDAAVEIFENWRKERKEQQS